LPELITTHSQSIDFTPKNVAIKSKLPTNPNDSQFAGFNHAAKGAWRDAKLIGCFG
jgi:hypothetical protein